MFITGRAFDRRWWGLLGARTRAQQDARARAAALTPRLRAFAGAPPRIGGSAAATSVECGVDVSTAISEALAEVGPTMTAAAACEAMAFIVGITLDIPALQQFCVVAAIAVAIDFVLQMTWFVAAMSLDARRQESRRLDLVCCVQLRGPGVAETRFRCCLGFGSFGIAPDVCCGNAYCDEGDVNGFNSPDSDGGDHPGNDPSGYGYGPAGMGIDVGLDVGYARPGPWLAAAVKAMVSARAAAAAAEQLRASNLVAGSFSTPLLSAPGGEGEDAAGSGSSHRARLRVATLSVQGDGASVVLPPPLSIDAAFIAACNDSPMADDASDGVVDGPDGHLASEAALLAAWGSNAATGGLSFSARSGSAVETPDGAAPSPLEGGSRHGRTFSSALGDSDDASPAGMPAVYVRALAVRRAQVASRKGCYCAPPPPCCPGASLQTVRLWFCFNRGNFMRRAIGRCWAPCVLSIPARIAVFTVWLLMLSLSVYESLNFQMGLEQQLILPKGSYLSPYFDNQSHLGDAGPPAYIVLQNVNYSHPDAFKSITNITFAVPTLSVITGTVYSWVADFQQWQVVSGPRPDDCPTPYSPGRYTLAAQVAQFIYDVPINLECCQKAGYCGGQYATDVVFLWGAPKAPSNASARSIGSGHSGGVTRIEDDDGTVTTYVNEDGLVTGVRAVSVTRVGTETHFATQPVAQHASRTRRVVTRGAFDEWGYQYQGGEDRGEYSGGSSFSDVSVIDDGGCDLSLGYVHQSVVKAAVAVQHASAAAAVATMPLATLGGAHVYSGAPRGSSASASSAQPGAAAQRSASAALRLSSVVHVSLEAAAAVGIPEAHLAHARALGASAANASFHHAGALQGAPVTLIPCHIMTSRLRTQHTPLHNQSDFIAAKQVMQTAMQQLLEAGPLQLNPPLPTVDLALLGVTQLGPEDPSSAENADTDNEHKSWLPDAPGGAAWPYSLIYVYYEQYDVIRGVAVTNVLAAIAAVFFASLLVSVPAVALLSTFLVASATLCLVGWVWLLNPHRAIDPDGGGPYGVDINAISVVNLVTATGLCVEFVIHVAAAFAAASKAAAERAAATRRKALAAGADPVVADASARAAVIAEGGVFAARTRLARSALVEMGSSVVTGITLTKLVGVVILALAPSELFRLYYFRMYLGIIVVGAFHGLALLPVLLATFGLPDW